MALRSSGDAGIEPPQAGPSRLRILRVLRDAEQRLGVSELAQTVGLHANTVRFHLDRLVAEELVDRQVEDRTDPGRPRLTFAATTRSNPPPDRRRYRLLAEMLAGLVTEAVPEPSAAATAVGRHWGKYLTERSPPNRVVSAEEAIGRLVAVLDEIGFAPELGPTERQRAPSAGLDQPPGNPEPGPADPGHPSSVRSIGWRVQPGADSPEGPGRLPEVWLRHCPFLEVADPHRDVVCALHLGLMQGSLDEMRAPVTASRLEPFVRPDLCVGHLVPVGATTS